MQRRIREFLRHGTVAEAGIEEWGEFAAQLRFLRELPLEERQVLLEHGDRVLTRALPDRQLAAEHASCWRSRRPVEGAAWAAPEDRIPLDQGAGVAPVLRRAVWTLDWEAPAGRDEDDGDHEDEVLVLVLKAAGGRTEARLVLGDRLVLAHLAADVRRLLAEGQTLPPIPDAEPATSLPILRWPPWAGVSSVKKDPLRPLTGSERRALEQLARSQSAPAGSVARAREFLAVSDGSSYTEAARLVGRAVGDSIAHWVTRFNQVGLAALEPRRSAAPPPVLYGPAERERILSEFRRPPDRDRDGTATWSLNTLQRALRRAPDGLPDVSTIRAVLHDAEGVCGVDRRGSRLCPEPECQAVRRRGRPCIKDLNTGPSWSV